jgi:hypothetical protein
VVAATAAFNVAAIGMMPTAKLASSRREQFLDANVFMDVPKNIGLETTEDARFLRFPNRSLPLTRLSRGAALPRARYFSRFLVLAQV